MPAASFYFILTTVGQVLKNWWWIPLPFILWKPFWFLYHWWRVDNWLSHQKWVLLEIKLPKEILKPIRAMETVMASIHGATFHPPDWWEYWVDGQIQLSVNFEIVSIDGEPHFYIRCGATYRDSVESAIYSQYPEAEIKEADDYTKYVPQNIPNKDWDLFASDYKLLKDDHYPIKTYLQFETEREVEEEKRIDPVAMLLEAFSKIKPGEQMWIQISASPTASDWTTHFDAWIEKGKELRDKLARRPEKAKQKPIIQEAAEILITGKTGEEKEEVREIIPPEMKLTPGEREIILGLEGKLSKPFFDTYIRFIYLGKRDIWFKPNFRLALSFFNSYMTLNLNGPVPLGKTLTKIHKHWFLPINLLRVRRHYLRCRKIFRNYIRRLSPFWPRPGGSFVLNTEELASLFHFPGEAVAGAPGMARVEAKKGGEPPELPIEAGE